MVAKLVDKNQKRRDIARAAMGVFSERGFDATSMSLVAVAAGVGKGTIYEYFDSKDEMIAAAILVWLESIIEGARSLSQRIEDPELRLRTFVSETMAEFTKDQTAIQIAINLVAFLDGICLHYYASGGRFDLVAQVDHYMKYLLEASLK